MLVVVVCLRCFDFCGFARFVVWVFVGLGVCLRVGLWVYFICFVVFRLNCGFGISCGVGIIPEYCFVT